jgi:hypothetical protein
MPQPSVPVMRRLLEQNFLLYYSRYALEQDRLCMRFDTEINMVNPNKLYYALKELATKSDKQDDLLVKDFSSLQTLDTDHMIALPDSEKEVKYAFVQKWISETLQYVQTLDPEKFSGSISYLLLTLAFRIDYLVCPEGSLQADLEKIPVTYFLKDEKPAVEKNNNMMEQFQQWQQKPKEEFFINLFRNKSCFSIVAPQTQKTVTDAINAANNNVAWYRDNNYPLVGSQICEYGIAYCQYSYSLPSPLSNLFLLFMQVNYSDYFKALGFETTWYDSASNKFNSDAILAGIEAIQNGWKKKYPVMVFNVSNLKFDSLLNFNYSFTRELETLNFDPK